MRLSKTVNGTKYTYLYQNGLLVQETIGEKILDYSYTSGGQILSVRYKTNSSVGGVYYYYALNTRGDVVGLYDSEGKLYAKYTYDAWGNPVSVTNAKGAEITDANDFANLQPLRYRSYYYDFDTGPYYLQSRYYDPVTHRFINADGLVSTGTGVLGYNMFAYCSNNPVNDRDEDGQLSWLAKIGIGVAAIAAGVFVTALTGGAALPALVAGVKAACIVGAISAATRAVKTAISSAKSGDRISTVVKKSAKSAVEGFADGFMAGGIAAGASQIASSGFKVAAKLGAKIGKSGGINIGNVKFLSPDAAWHQNNGGTLLKIGEAFRLDVGSNTLLHMHVSGISAHIPIGIVLAIFYEGLK